MVKANIPLAAAATAPSTKAGRFPPPNIASNGPLPKDTNICIYSLDTKINADVATTDSLIYNHYL